MSDKKPMKTISFNDGVAVGIQLIDGDILDLRSCAALTYDFLSGLNFSLGDKHVIVQMDVPIEIELPELEKLGSLYFERPSFKTIPIQ